MSFIVAFLTARFPQASKWVVSQAMPVALGLFAVFGLAVCWLVGGYIKERRQEARAEIACRAGALEAENAALKDAAAANARILSDRNAAFGRLTEDAKQLTKDLGETREKLATAASRARYCIPAGDEWLREWQRRGKAPTGGSGPRAGAVPRS